MEERERVRCMFSAELNYNFKNLADLLNNSFSLAQIFIVDNFMGKENLEGLEPIVQVFFFFFFHPYLFIVTSTGTLGWRSLGA